MLAWTVLILVLATSHCEAVQVPLDCEDCNENGKYFKENLVIYDFVEKRKSIRIINLDIFM